MSLWYFRQNSFEDIRTIHDWIAHRKEMAKTPQGRVLLEITDSDKNEPYWHWHWNGVPVQYTATVK